MLQAVAAAPREIASSRQLCIVHTKLQEAEMWYDQAVKIGLKK
jgi:hypothetical protein